MSNGLSGMTSNYKSVVICQESAKRTNEHIGVNTNGAIIDS